MQKKTVTVLAPAKLNLSLDVVGTLPGGYHDLDIGCRGHAAGRLP